VIAECIDTVLAAIGTDREATAISETKKRVIALSGRFPLPYRL
jgi:glycine hydroxymethyltransferase